MDCKQVEPKHSDYSPMMTGQPCRLDEEGLSMGIFEQAVANIAYLRAQTSGGMSRLNFADAPCPAWKRTCVPQSAELRMWISLRRAQI